MHETVDDAVRRGRMTREDAEELASDLVARGRRQARGLLAEVEQSAIRHADARQVRRRA